MFRYAARKSVHHSLRRTRQQSTQTPRSAPIPAAQKKSGGGKGLALVGLTVAGAGGVVGYAYVDPEFRHKVETTIPPTKQVFDSILGEANLSKTKKQVADIKEKVVNAIPKRKEEPLPPLLKTLPPIERKDPVYVDAVDVRKEIAPIVKPSPELVVQKNKQLEQSLKDAIQSAESRVHLATSAKMRTIEAINAHAQLIKSTVDNSQNADWEKVTSALSNVEALSSKDGSAENDSRNYIDNLKKIVSDGKANVITASNPLLLNALETANKLSGQLDELNSLVFKSRQESQVLTQYKDLIEKSRQQFALEMKSILPNVDIHAKDKTLNEDELNALIAHAHLKVDQLRRQLTEQQVREEQHIAKALEDQRVVDDRISNERLSLELSRISRQKEVDIERAVLETRSSWEGELEDQLKRTSAAHSEHLEQVIRTQRQLFEIEHNQKVEEAIIRERELHSRHVGAAISRLEGIEEALGSRVALDNENRRAKQFWIACHNLIDTIKHGNKAGNSVEGRRLSLKDSLDILHQVNPEDSFVSSIIAAFPQQATTQGVYTEQDLRNRFEKLYTVGKRTGAVGESGGTLTSYLWSYVRSIFLVDLPRVYTDADKIDPLTVDNYEVLARAKHYVEVGDLDKAVRVVQLLRGQPALLSHDWVVDTRNYLESRLLAQLLVAHAAVSSIRSTY
ncbi:unnamed protein product [Caenorhabditis auriculariae]|uniref:MICOS complex subunit MIC60 n=1 Tax=Caenorhabditis auriculariae TaxID=2777116 RepID=A0A8S1GPB1_9PELO|nr:unnamed protein product [Caenorhabditis auriculariae]